MDKRIEKQIAAILRNRKKHSAWIALVLCLAVLVTTGTAGIFHLTGVAKTHQKQVLSCTAVPPTGDGYAGYFVHTHNADCYDADGKLVCTLPVKPAHVHGEDCYTTEKRLVCTIPESDGHVHTDACYTMVRGDLICDKEFDEITNEAGEVMQVGHVHTDECYNWTRELTCGMAEGEGAHHHTDDCYVTETVLTCTVPVLHTHTESCYNEKGELICGMVELTEHVHTAECFRTVEMTDEEVAALNEDADPAETDTPEVTESPAPTETVEPTESPAPTETPKEITESDPTADLESAETWGASMTGIVLTGDWANDVLQIAQSQLGYAESARNFVETEDGGRRGYNRYAAWYSSNTAPYDDWDAMFTSFCVRAAQLPEYAFPVNGDCALWIDAFCSGQYMAQFTWPDGYLPKAGDMIFFDYADENGNRDGKADHVGIVGSVTEEDGGNLHIVTFEGNVADAVVNVEYDTNHTEDIFGYGVMPVNPDAPVPEETVEDTTAEAAAVEMPAQNFEAATDSVVVTVEAPEGAFPSGTVMTVTPIVMDEETLSSVTDAVEDSETRVVNAQAVDITFMDAEGNVIEPKCAIRVSMKSALVSTSENVALVHLPDAEEAAEKLAKTVVEEGTEEAAETTEAVTEETAVETSEPEVVENFQVIENADDDNEIQFESDAFSTYVIVETETISTEITLPGSNDIYEITVTYGEDANIPDGAVLSVSEIAADSAQYETAKDEILSAKKTENAWFDESSFRMAAFDISILDAAGNKVEPAEGAEVKVSFSLKKLPNGASEEALYSTMEIQHLNESTGKISVETVAEAKDVAFVNGTPTAEFTLTSFSTFALTWTDGSATIHWGTIDDGGSFIEFDAASLDTSVGSVNLRATYSGYEYVDAVYYTSEPETISVDATAAVEGRTFINDVITKVTVSETSYYWTAEDSNSEAFTIAAGSHIYAVYQVPEEGSTTPTPSGSTDIPTPTTEKTVSDNGDGTYKIELSITAQQITQTSQTGANVIVVFDNSGSMEEYVSTTKTRLEAAQDAVETLVNALKPGTNDIEMAFIHFAKNASYHTFSYTNSEGSNYWTTTGTDITSAANALESDAGGTNWQQALQYAYNVARTADDDPTYVIFVTDGCPSTNSIETGGHSHGSTGTSNTSDLCYKSALEYAKMITLTEGTNYSNTISYTYTQGGGGGPQGGGGGQERTGTVTISGTGQGCFLYGIYTGTDSSNLLATLITAAGGTQCITATSDTAITEAFNSIAQTIVNNLGASAITTNDGVTELSSMSAEVSGAAGAFEYYRRYTLTYDSDSGSYSYKSDGTTYTVTAEQVTAGADSSGNAITSSGGTYYITIPWDDAPGAIYNSEDGSVTWDLSSVGSGEAGVTYILSFTVPLFRLAKRSYAS